MTSKNDRVSGKQASPMLIRREVVSAGITSGVAAMTAAFVARPLERGPDVEIDTAPESEFDTNAEDFLDLARKLGA